MRKINLSDYDFSILTDRILDILMKKGIKAAKMDDIAIKLSISKRTLYEIFISKNGMAVEAMKRFHYNLLLKNIEFQKKAPSVMDSLMMSFILYREILRNMNVNFLRDFDNLPSSDKRLCDPAEKKYMDNFYSLLDRAAAEGFIRVDLDYRLKFRITQLQLSLVKRMGEIFPPDISMMQVYDTTAVGFLRGIASPKGLIAIDNSIYTFD